MASLPEGKYAARFEKDLKRFGVDLVEGGRHQLKLMEISIAF